MDTEPNEMLRSAGILGGVAAAIAGVWFALLALKHGGRAARFGYRAATFQLHRRCPDCGSKLWADARLCVRCGHRLAPAPAPRG